MLTTRVDAPVRKTMFCRSVATLALLTGLGVELHAQASPSPGVLRGRVFEARDTIGVEVASIDVVGTGRSATATSTGDFEIRGLPDGRYILKVRRLGYAPRDVDVEYRAGSGLVVNVSMERAARALTQVLIEGKMRRVPPRLEEVYWRMAHANGKFFTREDIDQMNPIDVMSLVQLLPTARVSDAGISFTKCDRSGAYMFSSPTQTTNVQIWIDGMRMTGRGERDQKEVLGMVIPSQIQAIEVYSGVARIPAEFLEDACAVIAIWRK